MSGKRRRWKPSREQLEIAVDAANGGVSLGSAAALIGVSPRTLKSFVKRIEAGRAADARGAADRPPDGPVVAINDPQG